MCTISKTPTVEQFNSTVEQFNSENESQDQIHVGPAQNVEHQVSDVPVADLRDDVLVKLVENLHSQRDWDDTVVSSRLMKEYKLLQRGDAVGDLRWEKTDDGRIVSFTYRKIVGGEIPQDLVVRVEIGSAGRLRQTLIGGCFPSTLYWCNCANAQYHHEFCQLCCEGNDVEGVTGYCHNCGDDIPAGSHCCRCHENPDFNIFTNSSRKYVVDLPKFTTVLSPFELDLLRLPLSVLGAIGRVRFQASLDKVCVKLLMSGAEADMQFAYDCMGVVNKALGDSDIEFQEGNVDTPMRFFEFMSTMMASMNSKFDPVRRIAESCQFALKKMISGLAGKCSEWTIDKLIGDVKSSLGDDFAKDESAIKLIIVALKTVARFYMDPTAIFRNLIEIMWDPWVLAVGPIFVQTIRSMIETPLPQSNEGSATLVTGLVMHMMGKAANIPTDCIKTLTSYLPVAKILATDMMVPALSSLPYMGRLFKDDEDAYYENKSPKTLRFKETVTRSEERGWHKAHHARFLQAAWREHISERKDWKKDDVIYWAKFAEMLRLPDFARKNLAFKRHQPVYYYIWGDPGQGKTKFTMQLEKAMYQAGRIDQWFNPHIGMDDFVYSVPKGAKFWHNYQSQPWLRWNDFLTLKEKDGASECPQSAMFLMVADEDAVCAPGAAIRDKERLVENLAGTVSSNLPIEQVIQCAGINNPHALKRRFTRSFRLKAKATKADGTVRYAEGEGVNQWKLICDATGEVYEFDDIAKMMRQDVNASLEQKQIDEFPGDYWGRIAPQGNKEALKRRGNSSVKPHDSGEEYGKFLPISPDSGDDEIEITASESPLEISVKPSMAKRLKDKLINFVESTPFFDTNEEEDDGDIEVEQASWSFTKPLEEQYDDWEIAQVNSKSLGGWFYDLYSSVVGMFIPTINIADISTVPAFAFESHHNERGLEADTLKNVVLELTKLGYYVMGSTEGRVLSVPRGPRFEKVTRPSYMSVLKWMVGAILMSGAAYIGYKGARKFLSTAGFGVNTEGIKEAIGKLPIPSKAHFQGAYFGLDTIKDPTRDEQKRSIENSMVEVYGRKEGARLGTAFFLNAQECVMPAHFFHAFSEGIWMKHNTGWKHYENLGNVTTYQHVIDTDHDLALVRFPLNVIPGQGRKHDGKLGENFRGGFVYRFGVTAEGELSTANAQDVVAFDTGVTKDLCSVSIPGQVGYCGAIYYLADKGVPSRIIGMHVAGDSAGLHSYFAPLTRSWLEEHQGKLESWKPMNTPEMAPYPKKGHLFDGKAKRRVNLPWKSAYRLVDDIAESFLAKGFVATHRLAQLSPAPGETESPYDRSVAKNLATYDVESSAVPFSQDVLDRVCDKIETKLEYDYVESWEEVAAACNDHAKVDGSKSAGWGMGLKRDYMEDGKFKSDFIAELTQAEEALARGDKEIRIMGTTLKDEKRPIEKTATPRIFVPVDIALTVLCKKWHEPGYRFLRDQGPRLGIHYAQSPEGSAKIRLNRRLKRTLGIDIKSQDVSHQPWLWLQLFQVLLRKKIFRNEGGDKVRVNPDLPAMDRETRIRWGLFELCMNYILIYYDGAKLTSGKLPSGLFFTTLFNCMSSFMLETALCVELDRDDIELDAFGDDAGLTCDEPDELIAPLISCYAKHGYTVTSWKKGEEMASVPHTDFPLCGRLLREHKYYGYTCPLVQESIVKGVLYMRPSAPSEYACTVNNFIVEATRHDKDTFDNLLGAMVWKNGVRLAKYVGTYETCCARVIHDALGDQESLCRDWVLASRLGEMPGRAVFQSGGVTGEDVFLDGSVIDPRERLMELRSDPTDVGTMTAESINPDTYAVVPFKYMEPIMQRRVLLRTFTVTSATANDLLATIPMPSEYFVNSTKALAALFDTYGIYYSHLKITIKVSGSGQVKFGYLAGASSKARLPEDIYMAGSGPHLIRNVAAAEDADLLIPYSSDVYAPTSNSFGTSGVNRYFNHVTIWLMAATNYVSASQSGVQFMVYGELVDARFMESGLTSFAVATRSQGEREDLVGGSIQEAPLAPTDAGREQAPINNYPFANWNVKVSAEGITLNKPIAPPQLAWLKGGAALWATNVRGGTAAQMAGVDPEQKFLHYPDLGRKDLMSIEEMGRVPSLLGFIEWNAIDAAETTLLSTKLTPFLSHAGGLWNSNQSYLGSCFSYYHYDCLKLRFVRIGPIMQGGSYEVAVNYARNADAADSREKTSAVYRVVVDLRKGADITIRVPWVDYLPARRVTFQTLGGLLLGELGSVSINTVTGLSYNSQSADSVSFAVYLSVEGFKLFRPFDHYSRTLTQALSGTWEPESGVSGQAMTAHDERAEKGRKLEEKEKAQAQAGEGDAAQGGAAFLPGSTLLEQAPEVTLGPDASRTRVMSTVEYANRFMGGGAVLSLKELWSREVPCRSLSTNNWVVAFNPSTPAHYPLYFRRLMEMFVFCTGGFVVSGTVLDNNTSQTPTGKEPMVMILSRLQSGPSTVTYDTFNPLDPIVRYVSANRDYHEVAVPRVDPITYPVWRDVQISTRFGLSGEVVQWRGCGDDPATSGDAELVCFRVGEDWRAYGKNYNRSITISNSLLRESDVYVLPT
jgi:hypothetical protein